MVKVIIVVCLMIVLLSGCGWIGGAAQVASEEFSARALFDRYLWLKDASAELDKKQADIRVYRVKLNTLEGAYEGLKRGQWPRDDREQYGIWASELAGVKASYNSLAAEYNSAMVKVNYRFSDVGQLPPGASTPLPREFKPYVEE